MAMIIGWRNYSREYVVANKGKVFTLEEMYKILDCNEVEYIFLRDGRIMVVDRNGKITGKKDQKNTDATYLFHNKTGCAKTDYIVGDVLIGSREEFD